MKINYCQTVFETRDGVNDVMLHIVMWIVCAPTGRQRQQTRVQNAIFYYLTRQSFAKEQNSAAHGGGPLYIVLYK